MTRAIWVRLRFWYRGNLPVLGPLGTHVRVEVENKSGGTGGLNGGRYRLVAFGWAQYTPGDKWDPEVGERAAVGRAMAASDLLGFEREAVQDALGTFQRLERRNKFPMLGRLTGSYPDDREFKCKVWVPARYWVLAE